MEPDEFTLKLIGAFLLGALCVIFAMLTTPGPDDK